MRVLSGGPLTVPAIPTFPHLSLSLRPTGTLYNVQGGGARQGPVALSGALAPEGGPGRGPSHFRVPLPRFAALKF
jgi:hypothetical protein